jgi:hypothetical protein
VGITSRILGVVVVEPIELVQVLHGAEGCVDFVGVVEFGIVDAVRARFLVEAHNV